MYWNFSYIQGTNILEMQNFLFLIFFLPVICNGQVRSFSFFAGANYPAIGAVTESQNLLLPTNTATGYSHMVSSIKIKQSFSGSAGLDAGGRVNFSLSKKFYLAAGLQLSYIRYQVNFEITDVSPGITMPFNVSPVVGVPIGSFYGSVRPHEVILTPTSGADLGKTTALMIQLPLTVGTKFARDRMRIGIGPVFSYLLHATQINSQISGTQGGQIIMQHKDTSKSNFAEYQAGAILQATYLVTDNIGVEFGAQKFFTPIYEISDNAKYNTFSLGLSYNL
jgi:hypothetical protein